MTDLVTVIAAELDEHGYEDDDEKRWQVARHFAERIATVDNRIKHVRALCESSIEFDRRHERADGWTDRHWLAQSVLNILDGNVDE